MLQLNTHQNTCSVTTNPSFLPFPLPNHAHQLPIEQVQAQNRVLMQEMDQMKQTLTNLSERIEELVQEAAKKQSSAADATSASRSYI